MSTTYTVPHTASFLLRFHSAAQGHPAERELAAAEDLLNEVPVEAPAYLPSQRQRDLIDALIREIAEFDTGVAGQAITYIQGMTANGKWTPENTSAWITRLIGKKKVLRIEHAPAGKSTLSLPRVADGRYAVEHGGAMKFFKVRTTAGGHVFLDVQASDEFHHLRSLSMKREILGLIAADPKAAMIRYGRELGVCGMCGRTLTDEESRAAGLGPICREK